MENNPPTCEAVAMRSGVPLEQLQTIKGYWTEQHALTVVNMAEDIRKVGMLAEVREIGRELSEFNEPYAIKELLNYSLVRLSGAEALQTNRKGDALSVSESAWAGIETSQQTSMATGLDWYDEMVGGIWLGFNYWIVGAYKSGKTTMLRNIFLNLALAGIPCDVFAAEGSREMFALDCQAMLATWYLCHHCGVRRFNDLRLSGLFIRRVWMKQAPVLTKQELEAVQWAREKWNTLNVRVWDNGDGITDLGTLRHRIQQSKFEYGSIVHFLDYSQLFGTGATLFERQSSTAHAVQKIATGENVAVWVLSQQNEANITGSEGYSPGVKGGGDAAAAADFVFIPKLDPDSETLYRIKLKLSRWSETREEIHVINKSSGLILDKWFKGRTL